MFIIPETTITDRASNLVRMMDDDFSGGIGQKIVFYYFGPVACLTVSPSLDKTDQCYVCSFDYPSKLPTDKYEAAKFLHNYVTEALHKYNRIVIREYRKNLRKNS